MHRGKVDPGVSKLPRGNELSRDHVNRPLVFHTDFISIGDTMLCNTLGRGGTPIFLGLICSL